MVTPTSLAMLSTPQGCSYLNLRSALIQWSWISYGHDFCQNNEVVRQSFMKSLPWVLSCTLAQSLAWCSGLSFTTGSSKPFPNHAPGALARPWICLEAARWSTPTCCVIEQPLVALFLWLHMLRQLNRGCASIFSVVLREAVLPGKKCLAEENIDKKCLEGRISNMCIVETM